MSSPITSEPSPGFSKGLRQPVIKVNLTLSGALLLAAENEAALHQAETLIQERLGLKAGEEQASSSQRLANLIGGTANALLQAIRIPCFEAPVGLPSPNRKELFTFLSPAVEYFHTPLYEQSYFQAAKLVFALLSNPIDSAKQDEAFDLLQTSFVDPISEKTPGGKSTISVLRVAFGLSIPIRHLGGGIYQLGWGAAARLVDRSSIDMDSMIGARVSTSKEHTALILRQAGLPVPRHFFVQQLKDAIEAAEKLGFPVVIKPNDRDRGEGVSIGVASVEEVAAGFEKAQQFSNQTLVEEQINGVCHRIFVAHGQLLFAIKRNPKSITGDGEKTIAELIEIANQKELLKAKHKRRKSWPSDELAIRCLRLQGYSLDSVPKKDERVGLRPIESTEWGGESEDFTETIHPENLQLALEAARVMRLEVAGVDLMTTDITRPWHETGAVLNEVNYAPFLAGTGPNTQAAIALFLNAFLPNQGRIPVVAYVGGAEAKAQALKDQAVWKKKKVACFVCTHEESLSPTGVIQHPQKGIGLFGRVRSLLMNRAVERLIVVVQTDEFLRTGLPVDRFEQVKRFDRGLKINPELLELFRIQQETST